MATTEGSIVAQTEVKALKDAFDKHEIRNESAFKEVWAVLDKLRDRLPVWAVFVFALLTGVVGYLIRMFW